MADDNAEVTFSESSRGLVRKSAKPVPQTNATVEEVITADASEQPSPPDTVKPAKKILLRPPVQPKVVLKQVVFEGNTVISDSELESLSNPYLNKPLRFSDLEQLRTDITRIYTDRGYINSGVVLPDQKVNDGQLTYRVIEGQLNTIEVSGTGRLNEQYVAKRVRAAVGVPFNSEKLQEGFQLLLDDPLIERMDGQLLPQSGGTSLKLNVTPASPCLLYTSPSPRDRG